MGKRDFEQIFETEAGLIPNKKELPYEVTTYDVRDFLQKRLDAAIYTMETNGVDVSDIKGTTIDMYAFEAGRNYLPFVIVLPTNVLASKVKNDDDGEDIFDTKSSSKEVRFKQPFWDFFKGFMYVKEKKGSVFSDPTWRNHMGVDNRRANFLKDLRFAKIRSFNHGKIKKVVFIIDPILVLRAMLLWKDPSSNDFKVYIEDWKKRESGQYKMDIVRVMNTGKARKSSIQDELQKAILSGYTR